MTTYAMFCTPGYGHVNPTLALAQELVARGERVVYYLSEEFRAAVEATGAIFRPYESEAWKRYFSRLAAMTTTAPGPDFRLNFLTSMATTARECVREMPSLLEQVRADQIDCILYDRMFVPAIFAIQALKLPGIQLMPSFAVNEHVFQRTAGQQVAGDQSAQQQMALVRERIGGLQEQLNEECDRYGVPRVTMPRLLGQVEDLNIVFVPRAFQAAPETFDDHYLFVGPSLPERRPGDDEFPLERLDGRPLLYISLGTAFNKRLDFYQMCFEAFDDSQWQVVLAFGSRVDAAELKEPPANFLVAPHVPQLEILARAKLFISHGGMNSTMESLWFGVPLIVVPQIMEQEMNGRRAQELGLGLLLEREGLTPEKLRAAVEQITRDEGIQARLRDMQQEMRRAGGYRRAADGIMRYVKQV